MNKLSLKGKLTWGWLRSSGIKEIADSWIARFGLSLVSGFFSFVLCWIVQGSILGTSGPDFITLALVLIIFSSTAYVLKVLPKWHYTYGLGTDQTRAIIWYRELTDDERKQLPCGWEDVVRESGNENVNRMDTVAREFHNAGRDVIYKYRQTKIESKVPDYRIATFKELMKERADEFDRDIEDRKEIEAQIVKLPWL